MRGTDKTLIGTGNARYLSYKPMYKTLQNISSILELDKYLRRKIVNNNFNNLYCIMAFEHRICALTQDLQIFKKFNMSQMNPKKVFHNTAYSVQLPYIAGHSL